MVAAGNDRLFALLCDVLELPELVHDARFAMNPERVRNRPELVQLVTRRLRERDSADWHARLTAAGVPAAPVADVADVVGAEQTNALGMLQPLAHPKIRELRLPALPLWFEGERVPHRSPPPLVGEHTAEILAAAGYTQAEIDALAADGVIRTRSPRAG
jgi:formyl-CoA transferase